MEPLEWIQLVIYMYLLPARGPLQYASCMLPCTGASRVIARLGLHSLKILATPCGQVRIEFFSIIHTLYSFHWQTAELFVTITDTNDFIILFPQAIQDNKSYTIWGGKKLSNPNGCWDWLGWYGTNADQIGGEFDQFHFCLRCSHSC